MRGIYLALEVTGWFALVPLSGVSRHRRRPVARHEVGLFRYWWVVVKLVITVIAVIVLLLYTQTLGALAALTREPTTAGGEGDVLPSRRRCCTPRLRCCFCS